MKRSLLMLLFAFIGYVGMSQTVVFSEDFEGATLGVTSSSTGSTGWGLTTQYTANGTYADSATVSVNDTLYLTTDAFSTLNNSYVEFEFNHIAKVSFGDAGYVEVSTDNGVTWTKLTGSQYLIDPLLSQFGTSNKFSVACYPTLWDPTGPTTMNNSWFKTELFNLSSLAANQASVKIRFGLYYTTFSSAGFYGWVVDDLKVSMAPSELIPPSVTMIPPVLKDTVYNSGPYDISAYVTDNVGVDTVFAVYTVYPDNITDTIGLTKIPTDTFVGTLPFPGFGRSISYYIKAIDVSNAANTDSSATYTFFCKNSPGGTGIVGTGTTAEGYPFYTLYEDSRTQMLYTAAELNAAGIFAGNVVNIGFDVTTVNTEVMNNFSIKLKNTTSTTMSGFETAGLSSVYSATYTVPNTGWIFFPISSFAWDGSSNLLVEICFDNTAWGGNSTVKSTAAAGMTWHQYDDGATGCSFAGGSVQADRPNISVEVQSASALANDIGVSGFDYPTGGVIANQNFDVEISLKNFGMDTITTASIDWKLDGTAKPTVAFTDSLKTDSTISNIVLGQVNVGLGSHTVSAWSTNPNGTFDNDISNDTSKFSFYACASFLSGAYTIGGTTPSFNTFTEAALALSQCGINGPVTFNVATGVYNEQIELGIVNGSSATNTITFQSVAADSSAVTMMYDAVTASDNFVVKLVGTSYITFKNIGFEAADSTFANVFVVGGNASDLAIENCALSTTIRPWNAGNAMDLISTSDSLGNNITITNNALLWGTNSIVLNGMTTPVTGWSIMDNEMIGHYEGGLVATNAVSIMIKRNMIEADTSSTHDSYNAIVLSRNTGTPVVEENMISTKMTQIAYGITLSNSEFDSLNPASVVNNMISLNGNSTTTTLTAGILINEAKNINVYYNTVYIMGAQANASAITLYDVASPAVDSRNLNIVNNIFANEAGSYTWYVTNVDTADFYNNYNNNFNFNNGTFAFLGAAVNDVADWMTKTGDAVNSIHYDPYFIGGGLHVANNLMNGNGVVIPGITTDIDGDTRNATNPDMGADEFDPSPFDATALAVLTPIGACGLSNAEVISLQIKNIGSSAINGTLNAKYRIKGSTTVYTEAVSTVINPTDTLVYSFTTTFDMDVTASGQDSVFEITAWVELASDPVQKNDTAHLDVNSMYQPVAPIASDTFATYGTSIDITAISNDSLYWYADDVTTQELAAVNVYSTPIANGYDTTTYWVEAHAGAPILKLTETVQYKNGPGYTSPYPANLPSGDYDGVEIANLGSGIAQLEGYTINVFFTTLYSYTFLAGDEIPNGEVIAAIYGGGFSLGHNTGNCYTISSSTNISSSSTVAYWLTDPSGTVVDAFSSNGATFPANSGVTAADFSNSLMNGGSKEGAIRTISDNNDGSDWQNATIVAKSFGTPNVQLPASGGSGCASPRVPLTVNIVGYPREDAGVSAINPSSAIHAGVPQLVQVEISNFAVDTLESYDVHWSINSVLQDTISFANTSILYQGVDTVDLQTITFPGGMHSIKAWTVNPNGIADTINTNDTSMVTFNACLSGTYTIGDTAGGVVRDFVSLTEAVDVLNVGGVCGHVVFNVDTGTYVGQLTINEIIGAGPNATITFQSVSADSTETIVTYNASSTSDNWVVRLNGADYITFKGMNFKSLHSTYGVVFEFFAKANYNTLTNNTMSSPGIGSSSYIVKNTSAGLNQYNTITYNAINKGYYGIYFYGVGNSSLEHGNVIMGNTVKDFAYGGIYIYYQDSIRVTYNEISSNSATYGLYSNYCFNDFRITNNVIKLKGSAYSVYGLYSYYANNFTYATAGMLPGLVANNMVHVTSTGTNSYGLYAYYGDKVKYLFNSIKMVGSVTNAYGIYQYNSTYNSTGGTFMNNNVLDSVGFYAAYFGTPATVTADHNNYYTVGSNLAYWSGAKADLAALQAASATDNQNSVSFDPLFMGSEDLHMLSTQLSALGTPFTAVPADIDGEIRDLVAPTIGADEVPLLPYDIGVTKLLGVTDTTYEGYTYPLEAVIKNYGLNTVYTYVVDYTINNGTPVSTTITDSIMAGAIDTVSLGNIVSPAGSASICGLTVYAADLNTFNDGTCINLFGVPTKDAQVNQLFEIAEGCNLGLDTVSIEIINLGIDTINATNQAVPTTVSYITNMGNTPVTETMSLVIAPGDTAIYTFATLASFTTSSLVDHIYDVYAWIDFVGDNVNYNDTVYQEVESKHSPASPTASDVTVPYATPATLTAISPSNDTLAWFTDSIGGTELHDGSAPYVTGLNYVDTAYFVEARTGIPPAPFAFGTGTVNNTGTGYPSPYGQYYTGNKVQYLIPASELIALGAGTGLISGLMFDIITPSGPTTSGTVASGANLTNFTIKVGHTTMSAMTAFETGLTQVSTAPSYISIAGWNQHNFTTDFLWDGVSNIVVETCFDNYVSGSDYSNNAIANQTATSYSSTREYHYDLGSVCSNQTGTSYNQRPNIQLVIGQSGCGSDRKRVNVFVSPQSANDVGVTSIDEPTTSVYMSNQDVKVTVENFGSAAQSNVPVSYVLDNGAAVTETITGPIAPNSTVQYVFSTTANMSTAGTIYSLKAYTGLTGDVAAINDTVIKSVEHLTPNYCVSKASYASYEDIAGFTFGGVSNIQPAPYSNLYTDWTNLSPGMISPGNTYPISIDMQYNTTSSTNSYGEVYIDYNRDGVFTEPDEIAFTFNWNSPGVITGNVTIPNNASVGTSALRIVANHNGTAANVTPCATYSYGETEDYTIMIAPKIPQDAGVSKIVTPTTVVSTAITPLVVEVNNYGSDSITSVDVVYILNSDPPVSYTHTTQIDTNGMVTLNLGNLNLNQGMNTLCVYTVLTGDNNTFNDQKCMDVYREAVVNSPYFEDFETSNIWFNDTLNTQWEMGAPTGNYIDTAYSGINAWVTKLDTNYINQVASGGDYLYSPKILVTGFDSVYFSFFHKMDLDASTVDRGSVHVSVDGDIFAPLGYYNDPKGTLWYNKDASGIGYWNYQSQDWQKSEYTLVLNDLTLPFYLADTLQFRFVFLSDGSSSKDGWAIDDVELSLPTVPLDAGVVTIDNPGASTAVGDVVQVKVTVQNFGSTTLSSVPVSYKIGNSGAITEIFTPTTPLALGDSEQFTFTQTYVAGVDDYQLCAYTELAFDQYPTNDEKCRTIIADSANFDVGCVIDWPTAGDETNLTYKPYVYVSITNYGKQAVTSIPLEYTVNTGQVTNDTWTGNLAPGQTVQHMFATPYSSILGLYTLCATTQLATDANSLNDESCESINGVAVGIDNVTSDNFTVKQNQPNPASNNYSIGFSVPVPGDIHFELRNSLGQLVMVFDEPAHVGDNKLQLDASNLNSGVYFYSIEFDGVRKTLQMIVTK